MSNNNNLCAAKSAKNDEFYTRLIDIENEMSHYTGLFNGKVVYCPCDNPKFSQFYHFFSVNFANLGLKKLICTFYDNTYTERPYATINDGNSITVEPLNNLNAGDFRSNECIEYLKQSDIVVTNPPFSLFRDLMALIVKYDKQCMLIGSQNAIKYADIFPLIKENRLWLGVNPVKMFKTTLTEIEDPKKQVLCDDSFIYQKFGNISWFTNLKHDKVAKQLPLTKTFDADVYPKYDEYDAIDVSKTADIPMDYDGTMGVPISFLDKYCPDQFEIIGTLSAGGKLNFGKASINGKVLYSRILIKRK